MKLRVNVSFATGPVSEGLAYALLEVPRPQGAFGPELFVFAN
jgi:hypothetical protein